VRRYRKTDRKLGEGGAHQRAAMAAALQPNPVGSAVLRSAGVNGRSRKEGRCGSRNLFERKSLRGRKGRRW
jgi:hypothetical protein